MRVFEVKPSGSVTLEHLFIKNSTLMIAAGDVLVSIFPVIDETEFDALVSPQPQFDLDRAVLLHEKAVYDSVLQKYTYALVTTEIWGLGIYMIRWEATVDGATVSEFDKLHVVSTTRQDIVDALEMPSSISAGGIMIDYYARVTNLRQERGLRIAKLTKKRRSGDQSGDRDYNRGS